MESKFLHFEHLHGRVFSTSRCFLDNTVSILRTHLNVSCHWHNDGWTRLETHEGRDHILSNFKVPGGIWLTFLKGRNFFHTKSSFLSFRNRVIREIIKLFCSGYKRNLNNTSGLLFHEAFPDFHYLKMIFPPLTIASAPSVTSIPIESTLFGK